ncbi:hypothetical protein RCL_jg21771.t1 [Rhizophagus clarus]|uniref:Uncharacterized protein n=1 Tax=Rhizophagus clarus TaxID=94130 RepID=A0A8H3L3U7_9GLOM|nr:hypothetical protein RCL_jg21771.t1 [Rhizophagus clarus]
MNFITFAKQFKEIFPNATPEEVNTAFKINNEHQENTFCTAIKHMIEEEQCIKETWKRRCTLNISTSMPFEDQKEFSPSSLESAITLFDNVVTIVKYLKVPKALQITRNYALVIGVTSLAIADFTIEDIQSVLQSIGQKYDWNEIKINEIYNLLLDSYDSYHFGSESRIFNGGQLGQFCLLCLHPLSSTSTLLPKEDYGDIIHLMESIFKTRFQILVLAGLSTHKKE